MGPFSIYRHTGVPYEHNGITNSKQSTPLFVQQLFRLTEETHFCPFVREIHHSLTDSPHKGWEILKVFPWFHHHSGRSPKVIALVSATNFSGYIIELLQLHDTIQIRWNYAWIHYNIAIRNHLMLQKDVQNLIFGTQFSSNFLSHGKHLFGKVINDAWYQACDLMRFIQQTHIYIFHQTYEYHLSHAAG